MNDAPSDPTRGDPPSAPRPDVSRRAFLQRSVMGAGAVAGLGGGPLLAEPRPAEPPRSPREVWIATFSQMGLKTETPAEMVEALLAEMEVAAVYRPDVVCLPEFFPFANVRSRPRLEEVAEEPLGPISGRFAEYARRNRCYVVCPIFTRDRDGIYNAAVVIDRDGRLVGEYRKMRPTEDEMEMGISPGPTDPPVFRTDFGTIGVQICYDIEWADGWRKLRAAGAEMVFWPSAFAGGSMVNTAAWQNKVVVVSSTQKDTAKICDVTGREVARTGRWSPNWAFGSVNLEKVFLHTWPYNKHFRAIRTKYGRKVSITNFDEEEWTILESHSADVRIADVVREFGLKTHEEHLRTSEQLHQQFWART